VASNNALMRFIILSFRSDLIEDGNNKDGSFAHTRFSLAENILALKSMWNGVNLNFTGMFKPTLSNSSLKLILQEQLVPSS